MIRVLAVLLGLWAGAALAQQYPSKPVRLINPYAAGGPADLVGRELAKGLGEVLGQSIIVENRPGGGTMIGAEAVVKAAPDGYTFLVSTASPIIIAPAMERAPRYDGVKDLVPVTMFAAVPNLIATHPSVPVKTLKELIDYARANPGKLAYASAGNGSSPHLAGEQFKQLTGVDLVHVPYKGGAPAAVDLLAGQVQLAFLNVSIVLRHVQAGKLNAIATTSLKRSSVLPDVPTAHELGMTGWDSGSWYGLHAPAGTPRAAIDAIYNATRKVMQDKALVTRLADTQGADAQARSPEEFAAFIRAEHESLVKLVKSLNLKAD
jgi:tripartite-type tricarboxylate transporter receptor subunit TctC